MKFKPEQPATNAKNRVISNNRPELLVNITYDSSIKFFRYVGFISSTLLYSVKAEMVAGQSMYA
jgi:hypothetical protein